MRLRWLATCWRFRAPCEFIFRLKHETREPINLKTVLAGIVYIWKQKVVFGSISLDLFAVLLGGAVALLPAYAREILHTGPWGLGILRSAPGSGSVRDGRFCWRIGH